MPTFTQAQTVAPGDKLKASQLASLAAAFNSRILSGVGDWVWRVAYYLHSGLFRQLRNSDGAFSFPPDAEFWNIYQHVDPNDAQYPLTGPGDPEGANLANMICSFVYGGEAVGLDTESRRLADVPTSDGLPPPWTPRRLWALAKGQRGAFDPLTGATGWPAGDAARSYAWIRQSQYSPHGNAWGGWMPSPTVTFGGCADPDDPNFTIKFTHLVTGAVKTYGDNCPEDPNAVAVSYAPFAYYIFHASGALEILSKAEWIEGPYTDEAVWTKTQANALSRALNHYTSEFRGTPAQGGGTTNAYAFDLQRFLTTQYPLAPNIGAQVGGGVTALYPRWRSGTSGSDGDFMPFWSGGTSHTWNFGTVCTGFLVWSQQLTGETEVEILEAGEVLHSITLPAGDSEQFIWLPTARALSQVKVRLASNFTANGSGGIEIEATELLEMKPALPDYYLVARLSAYTGGFDRIDGRGIDAENAKEILEALYANGCITSPEEGLAGAAADPVLNQNAVFDAARRFSQHVRIIPRWQFTGYAVEDGKSVLWFNRTSYGPPGMVNRDAFSGIGPAQEEIVTGPIKWGRLYVVTAGAVTYNGRTYTAGERFIGAQGLATFEGGGKCKEYQGIKETAEPNDFSNEWAVTLTLKPYHTSNSSIWKTDGYGDVLTPFMNRCHLDSPEIDASKTGNLIIGYGQGTIVPESPSGFNYARLRDSAIPGATHANKRNCGGDPFCEADNVRFYKSCRIFEPPLAVESAVMDGTELKLTLSGRLHSHEDAPSSIGRDVSGWTITDVRDEDYRTHENGLREYLIWMNTGTNASVKIGDNAINSSGPGGSDTPFGSVLPTFVFCKLIPTPYLDGNDTQEGHDSYTTHDQLKQAELYLRAGCEGFVDGVTTAEVACELGNVSAYDYTFENLMFQACGNRWVPLTNEDVRPDNPQGFGPLPNVNFYSQTYNALARGVNLLTDARIMIPSEGQHRLLSGTSAAWIDGVDACGSPITCAALVSGTFVRGSSSLDAPASTPSGWNPGFLNGAGFGVGLTQDVTGLSCNGSKWQIEASRNTMQIRWALLDPDAVWALPGDLAALMDNNAVAAMQIDYTVTTWAMGYGTIGDAGGNSSGFCGGRPAGSEYAHFAETNTTTSTCGAVGGTIVAPYVAGLVGLGYESAGVVMTAGPASSASPTVYEDGTALVRCPTVAYSGGS